jgi:LEA14-like dessication related protein
MWYYSVHVALSSAALVSVAIGGLACSGFGLNLKEPDIRLDRAVLRGVGLTGGNLDLIVKVDNPNNFTLHGTRLQLGLDVEESHLGDVTYDDDFAVQENGETTLTLPLSFTWSGVSSAVRAALTHGDLPYKMKGQATLKLPGGLSQVASFTHEGRVPLTRAGGNIAIPGVGQ